MNQWIHVYICLPNRSEQVKLSDAKKTSSKSIEDKDGQRNGTPSQDVADSSANSILEQVSLVQIVQAHLDEQHLEHKWEVVGEHYLSVEFYCHVTKVEELVDFFINGGIGKLYNSYYRITPCLFYQSAKCHPHDEESGDHQHRHHKTEKKRSDFLETMKSRITVQQVVEVSRSGGIITFDYAVFLICAGLLAATGLVENSSVVLVASMLVSPIMGPILAGTFGMSIRDKNLYRLGIVNELISLASCLLIGFCYGLIYSNMHNWHNGAFITDEMKSRGQIRSLGIGFLVALPSGVGVALSVLGNNVGSLVGVAISASLLPPMVNAGILFSLSLVRTISGDLSLPNGYIHVYSTNLAEEAATLAGFSICLTLLNIFCIIIMGLSVLKIKQVVPRASNPIVTKFWTQDLSVVRDLNVRAKRDSNMENHDPYRTTLGLESLFDDMQVDPAYKTICASAYRNPHGKLSPAIDHTIHPINPFAGQRGGSRRLQRFSLKHRDDPTVVLENEEDVVLRRQPQTPPAGNGINLRKLFTRKETLTDLLQKRRSNNKFQVTKIAEEVTSLNP